MITPDEIRKKAERLYPKVIDAWLNGDDLFPLSLNRVSTRPTGNIVDDQKAIEQLREGSKQQRGFGYSITWVNRKRRATGRNVEPAGIFFETIDDLLRLTALTADFKALTTAATKIRSALPELETWVRSNHKALTAVAAVVDDLISVTQWFREHPTPDCFAREIPLSVHGKFVEENQGILRQWFDERGILPVHAIRAHETDFFRRYGLRDQEPLTTIRCSCTAMRERFGLPCDEASVPVDHFNKVDLSDTRIFVVENLTNLRTFPRVPGSVVIFGMGNAAVTLRALDCLTRTEVFYWGDLDVYGLRILSNYRREVGPAQSLFMDIQTVNRFAHLMQPPRKSYTDQSVPKNLEPKEAQAFAFCNEHKKQLEQERIPQSAVQEIVDRLPNPAHRLQ